MFFIFNSINGNCQKNEQVSKVYLYDGSIYIGKITEDVPDKNIMLQLNDSMSMTLVYSQIKKIIHKDNTGREKTNHIEYEFREKGFYNVNYASLSGGNGVTGSTEIGFGLSSSFGYMFNKYIGLGIGIGVDKFDVLNVKNNNQYYYNFIESPFTNTYPLFIEARGYFYGKMNAYYYSFSAGYGLVNKNEDLGLLQAHGGLMYYPAIGIRFGGKNHFNFCMDFGLKIQKADFVIQNFFESGTDHYFVDYKRFILRLGIQI
jgi:hypothetical protein